MPSSSPGNQGRKNRNPPRLPPRERRVGAKIKIRGGSGVPPEPGGRSRENKWPIILREKAARSPLGQLAASLLIAFGNFSVGILVFPAAQGLPWCRSPIPPTEPHRWRASS